MKRALALSIVAVAISLYAATRPTGQRGDTGVTTLVHDYLAQLGAANGITFDTEKVLAYRVTANESVARVKVTYRTLACDPFTARCAPVETTKTVVLHWERTPWQLTGFKVAG